VKWDAIKPDDQAKILKHFSDTGNGWLDAETFNKHKIEIPENGSTPKLSTSTRLKFPKTMLSFLAMRLAQRPKVREPSPWRLFPTFIFIDA